MDSMIDTWGYYNRECTSFVAWRLHSRNNFEMPWAIGNAGNWGSWANSRGYSVNMNPAVGSVAWFSNHVAWVEAVNGNYVTIEEYNNPAGTGNWSQRTIAANSVSGYIHFKDLGSAAGLTYLGTDHLEPGQIMGTGQYILSGNVLYLLVLQADGNLVLYGNGFRVLWASNTAGSGAAYAVMQADGNLVLYRANWTAVWSTRTAGHGNSKLYMQEDGNVVIYTSSWAPTWNSMTGGSPARIALQSDRLVSGPYYVTNDYYWRSSGGRYALLFQEDGNLVLYGPGYHVIWASGTSGSGAAHATYQSDGNFVLYTDSWKPVWATYTFSQSPSFLIVQDDGNLVIYADSGQALWASKTAGKI
jgi:hypothetical protein